MHWRNACLLSSALLPLLACDPAATPTTPTTVAGASTAPETPPSAALRPPPDLGAGIDMSLCVAHAGGGKAHGSSDGQKAASCWYNAECSNGPGQPSPSGGDVSISCEDDQCHCSFRKLSFANESAGPAFRVKAPCAEDRARSLLFERCVGRPEPKRHDEE